MACPDLFYIKIKAAIGIIAHQKVALNIQKKDD